jgi:hypothetical protein
MGWMKAEAVRQRQPLATLIMVAAGAVILMKAPPRTPDIHDVILLAIN